MAQYLNIRKQIYPGISSAFQLPTRTKKLNEQDNTQKAKRGNSGKTNISLESLHKREESNEKRIKFFPLFYCRDNVW